MRDIQVADVMSRPVVTAPRDAPVRTVAELMRSNIISGVPIVDEDERLVGIVTEADLLRSQFPEEGRRGLRHGRKARQEEALRADDLMTADPVTLRPEMAVAEGARILLGSGLKRVPVVDEEKRVVGIVSHSDLLRPYLRSDEDIRREIVKDVILRAMWIDPTQVDVRVDGGVVELGGHVEFRSTREILVEMVGRVAGVTWVEDKMTHERDDREVGTGPTRAPYPGYLQAR
jgi:CBS-domain-containing membrane protein